METHDGGQITYRGMDTPILRMRYGNKKQKQVRWTFKFHSNPTYEVWKPNSIAASSIFFFNSNPTYEVWKPINLSSNHILKIKTPILPMRYGNSRNWYKPFQYSLYSNPTYEVWKLKRGERLLSLPRTPILPMRYGN